MILNLSLKDTSSLNTSSYFLNQQTDITDWQAYEDQAETIIKKCADATRQLKNSAFKETIVSQYRDHLENMFFLVDKYLKGWQVFYRANFLRHK